MREGAPLLPRRRSPRAIVALLAVALLLPTVAEGGAAAASVPALAPQVGEPGDRLPDLELHKLYGLTIRATSGGRKRLRFGTRAYNIGAGPLEVRGSAPASGLMNELVQWIASDAGGRTVSPAGAQMFWAGDGHAHWHLRQLITVELYKPAKPASRRLIRKIGFCLVDLVRRTPAPTNASARTYGSCGRTRTDKSITMGISVGWADDYQPLIAKQWIDVTGLRKGVYRLCATVNPTGEWLESNSANNYFWYDIWMNPARSRLEIRASGRSACGSFAP